MKLKEGLILKCIKSPEGTMRDDVYKVGKSYTIKKIRSKDVFYFDIDNYYSDWFYSDYWKEDSLHYSHYFTLQQIYLGGE